MTYVKLPSTGTILEVSDPSIWPEAVVIQDGKEIMRHEAKRDLLAALKAGDTVYTVLRGVSRSGMSRHIDLYVIGEDRRPWRISGLVRRVLDMRTNKQGALKIKGCGMDMGFHVVNSLSMALFCPDKYTHDGAYALNHAWL